MKCQTIYVEEGGEVQLPDTLGQTDVDVINGNTLSVIVDETATDITYVRKFKRSTGPTSADIQIPDDAVIAEFTGSEVTYLEAK